MAPTLEKPPTLQEYLDWEDRQPDRHELRDGVIRAMTGGTDDHAAIAANVIVSLHAKLRGTGCHVRSNDLKVVVDERNVFYPDALVVCGQRDPRATSISDPVLAVEVTSPSSVSIDHARKGGAYRRLDSLRHYLIVSHAEPHAVLWIRGDDGWADAVITPESGGTIALGHLAIALTLAELYAGTSLEARAATA